MVATTFRALRHPNYRLFFAGQLVSLTGTWMQSVAQSWLIYRLTGSAGLLGAVGFAGQFPVFLLASLGGIVADRYNRRRVLIATQTAAMLLAGILAALTLSGHVHEWHVFALAAGLGVVNAIDIPTRQAFVVELVDRPDFMNAIALNSAMFNGARVVGPALAGMLVASIGEGWCFAANAVSYVAVIAGLSRMRVAPRGVPSRASSGLADLLEGFRFAWRTVPIRMLLLTLGLVSFVAMPYTVLMPIFADGILHAGPRGLGILMGASGLGALAGALTLAARTDLRGLGRWIAVAMAGFGSGLTAFALSRSFWPSAALLLVSGACMMVQMSASNTLIQAMVPDHLRGRVMAIYSMMFMGLAPLGALLAGSLAERLGAPVIVAVGGALAVLGSLAFSLLLPSLRPEAARLIGAQHSAAGEPPLGSPRVA